MKFLRIHVLEKEDLKALIENGECTCLEDIDVNKTDFDWDYAQQALVDVDENKVVLWNDNIHTNIGDDIDNFLYGIEHVNIEFDVEEIVMMYGDMKKFGGVKYR